MSKKTKEKDLQDIENKDIKADNIDTAATENAESETTTDEELPIEEQDETAKLTAEIDDLKAQIDKQKDDYLRLMAEFDNYRRRTMREKADLIKTGGESCMKAILPVIDDFERAMQAVKNSNDVDALKEGVSLIYNKFLAYLDQNGVKEMETIGAEFDADKHEAIAQIPAPAPEQKGKIIDCTQKGYTLNDVVIRFPKVVVAQ
ncbi:MAG: nucleotide exchange factor GrpE [Bacteroidaceae bacterium]|jgi:molecular chaperone GrpE|nr:nucleotide exchange factor GrpE [Bacteroidaceae bacterium]MBR5003201.1 nucleotide exchange factor GrpE [Bacteroidaceae bacterium]